MKHSLALTAIAAAVLVLAGCSGSADPNYMPVAEELDVYKVQLVDADREGFRETLDIECSLEVAPSGGKNRTVTLTTLNQVWELLNPQQRYKCDATVNKLKTENGSGTVSIVSNEITAAEESSYKASDEVSDSYARALLDLYSKCATHNMGFREDSTLTSDDARNVKAASMLCPDQPELKTVTAMAEALDDEIEDEDAYIEKLRKAKEQAIKEAEEAALAEEEERIEEYEKAEAERLKAEENMIEPGSYLVGNDVKPGTYKSTHSGFENCYWETSDKNGNIIDNKWAIEGKSMIAVIPKSAYIFETSGCGTFHKQ